MLKKCKVVMLSTEKAENAIIHTKYNTLTYWGDKLFTQDYLRSENCRSSHLYITSDEKINQDNWCILTYEDGEQELLKFVEKTRSFDVFENLRGISVNFPKDTLECCRKIIATTDKSIGNIPIDFHKPINFPQPSEGFIRKYIAQYNINNILNNILVEYKSKFDIQYYTPSGGGPECARRVEYPPELIINPKDNTITIKKIKDSWSRGEIIDLANNLYSQLTTDSTYDGSWLDKWIEENL